MTYENCTRVRLHAMKRIVTHYVDDIDGAPVPADDVHSVVWSWRGVDYGFDTSAANLERISAGDVSVATLLKVSVRTGRVRGPHVDGSARAVVAPSILRRPD